MIFFGEIATHGGNTPTAHHWTATCLIHVELGGGKMLVFSLTSAANACPRASIAVDIRQNPI